MTNDTSFLDLPEAMHAANMTVPSRIPNTLSIRNPEIEYSRYIWHQKKWFKLKSFFIHIHNYCH